MAFENLRKKDSVKADGDVIFGSTLDSDIYPVTLDMVYVDEYDSGAAFMFVSAITDTGQTISQRITFTSGDDKDNAITYPVKKNGKPTGEERYLPGYTFASDLHFIATEGEELADMEPEEKLVKVWDKEAGAEKPTKKQVLTALIGQRVMIAVELRKVFKQVNQDGKYVNTDEVISTNEMVKVFHESTTKTSHEIENEMEAGFYDRWLGAYKGRVFDKTGKKGEEKSTGKTSTKAPAKKKKMFD